MTAALAAMPSFGQFIDYGFHWPLLGGAAIAMLSGLLSVLVLLKRMSFIGQGISHAAFGGVGLAFLGSLAAAAWGWGAADLWGSLFRDGIIALFCVLAAVAIGFITRRGRFAEDTSIGIVLVAAMALGVLLVDIRQHWLDQLLRAGQLTRAEVGYTVGFHNILFGDILSLGPAETIAAWALAAIVILWMAALFKELVFFAFDEETATVFGVRTSLLYYGLLVLLGLAIVAALRGLGVILASALLVLPGASARSLSNRVGVVTFLSAAIAVLGLAGGFLLSLWLDYLTPGPVIVLTLCVLCAACYALGKTLRRKAPPQ